jgi:hypothetical protein
MFYIIYKITNKIDGKYYIGSHKTKNLNDGYMGSGKYLKYAQNKYGLNNFTKEILFIYDNPGDMYCKESEIVNEEFICTENTYNIKLGGFGGWDYLNETGLNNSTKSKDLLKKPGLIHKEKLLNDEEYRNNHCSKWKERLKKAHKEGKIRYDTMRGKTHSDTTKKMIGMKNSISQKGEKNSQFGTMWITNGIESIRVKKDSVIPEGWNKGRKMKVSPY